MVTEESLNELYRKMSTEDLLEIAKDKIGYTELANSVALEKLKHRKVTPNEITQYESIFPKIDDDTKRNCLVDLEFSKKLLYFFVLWFPRARRLFASNFRQDGYILKIGQSNYYSVLGFIFVVASFIIASKLFYNLTAFLILWIAFFFLSYLFDIYFNRQRQMENIQKAIDSGEIPWGLDF